MEADIQQDSGKTLRRFTIHALFPLSIFTEPLQLGSSVNKNMISRTLRNCPRGVV